jgi:hypothetical protein
VDADEARLDTEQPRGQEVVRASIERPHRDDMSPVGAGGEQDGGDRRHAAAEGDRFLRPFECCEPRFEARHRRVVQAAVDRCRRGRGAGGESVERRGGLVEIGERVGRREVDRRCMHAELGEAVASGVGGKGVDGCTRKPHRIRLHE